jgi:4-amino-4-deoxy-L-arabinose transferase-like glycosyltransferase
MAYERFGAMKRGTLLLLLLSCCALLYLPGLGARDLYDTMEASRAVVAREMLRTGEYAVPTLQGQPYLVKPPFYYWAILASSVWQGEVTAASARFPSAAAAIALVLSLFWLLEGALGREAAFFAAVATATNLMVYEKATSAHVDMVFSLWVILSLLGWLHVRLAPAPATRPWLFSVGGFSLAVLTKGPPALLFWVPIGLVYLWREGALRKLTPRALLLGLLTSAALVLPWLLITVVRYGWEPCWQAFYAETFPRITQPDVINRGPWWFYLVQLPLVLLPWVLFIPLAWRPKSVAGAPPGSRPALVFLRTAGWVTLILFSFSSAKEMRYVLPVVPLLAALGAYVAARGSMPWLAAGIERYQRHAWGAVGVVMTGVGIGLPVYLARRYSPGMAIVLPAAGILLAAAAVMLVGASRTRHRSLVVVALLIASFCVPFVSLKVLIPAANAAKSPAAVCRDARSAATAELPLYLSPGATMGMRFYADVPVLTWDEISQHAARRQFLLLMPAGERGRLAEFQGVSSTLVKRYSAARSQLALVRVASAAPGTDRTQEESLGAGSRAAP